MYAVENERISHGGLHVYIYPLGHTSFFVLAVGAAGAGGISNRLDFDASIPPYWSDNEWTFYVSRCTHYAASENSAGTESEVKN